MVLLFATSACLFGQCDLACVSTRTLVLESMPAEPFEVVLEHGGSRIRRGELTRRGLVVRW